jgi:hypothetical protein
MLVLDDSKAAIKNGAELLNQFLIRERSYSAAAKKQRDMHRKLQLEMLQKCRDDDILFKVKIHLFL